MTKSTLQSCNVEYWISWPIDDPKVDAMNQGEFRDFYSATDLANRAIRANSPENLDKNLGRRGFRSSDRVFSVPKKISYLVYHFDEPTNQTEVALSAMTAGAMAEREACFSIFQMLATEPILAINVQF